MNKQAVVQIIATPIACAEGYKDSWRETARWAGEQLRLRFGEAVRVDYFDLFDPDCPALPDNVQLPLILMDDQVISSGGKISIPAIRKQLEANGIRAVQLQNISPE